ncbi:MAG: hypothetical protein Q9193_001561 [Seirophora villosa]
MCGIRQLGRVRANFSTEGERAPERPLYDVQQRVWRLRVLGEIEEVLETGTRGDEDIEGYASPPISSTPLKPDQVRNAFSQMEYGALAEILRSLGVNTSGKSQADLVDAAWTQFSAAMGNLDLGQVNAGASFANFEAGSQAWTYYSDRIG